MDHELPGGVWSGWQPFSPTGFSSPVAFASGTNGTTPTLFPVGAQETVVVDEELASGAWTGWQPLSSPSFAAGPVTVAPGSNGSLQELFIAGPDAAVWMDYQLATATSAARPPDVLSRPGCVPVGLSVVEHENDERSSETWIDAGIRPLSSHFGSPHFSSTQASSNSRVTAEMVVTVRR